MIITASKLYDKFSNLYTTYKFPEDLKKGVDVLNKPKMLILDFNRSEYDLPPMPPLEDIEKVRLEPEKKLLLKE